ncbi:MAG: AmmeMemoRadiSam system protein B [Candidatus Cloacimonetes bacterium]|nr:AmmeMemoRadiSam system protein B [Candidatus Cloacimonadota bacterium]
MIRNPVVAGSFYPGDGKVLKTQINDFLENVELRKISGELLGVVAPHAGYVYSGQCAAFSFKTLKDENFKYTVIIAPSHRFADFDFSIGNYEKYLTPLGSVDIATNIVKELKGKYGLKSHNYAHNIEHSLEVQLPFLQIVKPEVKIVPILLGTQSKENSKKLAHILAEFFKDKIDQTKFVISTDLSHYYTSKIAKMMDTKLVELFEKLDVAGMEKNYEHREIEACGMGGILTLMNIAKLLNYSNSAVLDYRNSGDVSGDYEQVVGYFSSCIYK